MSVELIAEKKILIPATPEKVWNVLVKPRLIRKWDELPQGFGNKTLDFETVLRWDHPGEQFTELTVTAIEPRSFLRMALFKSEWDELPSHPITYCYRLEPVGSKTRLTITVGDFGQLEDGLNYFHNAEEYVKDAARKISKTVEEL